MGVRTDYINFGNTDSIEKYLEQRCGKPLQHLKDKGVLNLVARNFANQSFSTKFGDMPLNSKLELILTGPDSNLGMDHDLIVHSITPILTSYLKEYAQEEVKRYSHEEHRISSQNENKNRMYYLALAVIGVAFTVFTRHRFKPSSIN